MKMTPAQSDVPSPPSWREYLDARLEPLATKEAIADLKAELRSEIRDSKIDIIKWNVGTLIALAALVWAVV